jgi:hypothetical protein
MPSTAPAGRGPSVLSPIRLAHSRGFYRGVVGGSTGWAIVYVTITGARMVRRVFGKHPEVAAIERLEPGQFVTIRAIAPPTRRERKAAKLSARSAKL